MKLVAAIACVALAGCGAVAKPSEPRPASYVRVIDGDTIVVRGERVRLENIDAPELPPHSKCWAEAALAVHALRAMQGYINEAPNLRIDRRGRDRYGRTLARLSVRGADLGDALVGMGVAARWVGHRWDWCGPADLGNANGPSLLQAPGAASDEFMDWASEEQDRQLEDAARDAGLKLGHRR